MRNLILGFSTLILLSSCGTTPKPKTAAELVKDGLKRDSIYNAIMAPINKKNDSLALIAWGDAKFGMSVKEVQKIPMFKKAYTYLDKTNPWQSLKLFSNDTNIEGVSVVDLAFFRDRLYRVDLGSNTKTANYYDTEITETVNRLKDLIETKYGKPNGGYGMPSFLSMKPDKSITAYSWTIGKKYIEINVEETYRGSEYKVNALILHNPEAEPVREYNRKKEAEKEAKKVNGF